jgi:peptidylprolyl isomerase
MMLKRTLVASAIAILFSQAAFAVELGTQDGQSVTDTDILNASRDNGIDLALVPAPNVENAVKQELGERMLAAEARKAGTDKSPEVQRAMQRAAETEMIKRYIISQSAPPAGFPSDTELRAAYDQNKAKLTQPKMVRLAEIYLVGIDSATQAKAKALASDLSKNPDGFADAAARNGGDRELASRGGDWVAMRQLPPEFASAVDATRPGSTTKVIADKTGFHIIKVFDRREETIPTLEQARPQLTQAMRESKQRELAAAFVNKLSTQYPPTINSAAIAKISAPAPAGAPATGAASPSLSPAPTVK